MAPSPTHLRLQPPNLLWSPLLNPPPQLLCPARRSLFGSPTSINSIADLGFLASVIDRAGETRDGEIHRWRRRDEAPCRGREGTGGRRRPTLRRSRLPQRVRQGWLPPAHPGRRQLLGRLPVRVHPHPSSLGRSRSVSLSLPSPSSPALAFPFLIRFFFRRKYIPFLMLAILIGFPPPAVASACPPRGIPGTGCLAAARLLMGRSGTTLRFLSRCLILSSASIRL